MSELWASIIGAFIRFFDNRFVTPECQSCRILETEIARLRADNSSLVDRLLGQVIQPTETQVAADSKLEPNNTIRRNQTPWVVKQRELELAHLRPGSGIDISSGSGTDLETFENNLKELEK